MAAITEFEVIHRTVEGVPVVVDSIYTTGVYGMYNPLTIFIYNFESWRVINETPISQNPNGDYTLNSTYPYFPSGNIITEDIGLEIFQQHLFVETKVTVMMRVFHTIVTTGLRQVSLEIMVSIFLKIILLVLWTIIM